MPEAEENPCWERQLGKELLLLATLTVGVTYVAGINPPGGVWQENGSGHQAGDTILLATHRRRYLVFYYCNSTALAASVVVIFLLLLKKPKSKVELAVMRVVMFLDLLSLIGAYVAGSSRESRPTGYITSVVTVFTICIVLIFFLPCLGRYISLAPQDERHQSEEEPNDQALPLKSKERRKVLMLLATFVAVSTYVAGLSSSGRYWGVKLRFRIFFYFNATAFTASLLLFLQLLSKKKEAWAPLLPILGMRSLASAIQSVMPIIVMLLGLLGAYAMATWNDMRSNCYILAIVLSVLAYLMVLVAIFVAYAIAGIAWLRGQPSSEIRTLRREGGGEQEEPVGNIPVQLASSAIRRNEDSGNLKSLILLLATLAATATYQAGLHPPGGVWTEGHRAGLSILLSTHPWRYKIFLYCNSGAFLLSTGAIVTLTVHKDKIQIHTMLRVSVILDMFALMGAIAAGSCWSDARSTISVVAMASVVIVCLVIHLVCVTLRTAADKDYTPLKKRHKRLLLVAILVATITYHAGLNPPGGFQRQEDDGHASGVVLLMDNYAPRFWVFFYCNTASFMATIAVILFFFVSPNLDRHGKRCYPHFYGWLVLALLCLMDAYAAGIVKHVWTYAYVFVLLAIVLSVVGLRTVQSRAFLLEKDVVEEEEEEEEEDGGITAVFGHVHMPGPRPRLRHIPRPRFKLRSPQEMKYRHAYASLKHMMLLGVLTASATYWAGLNPPGGLWQDNGNHGDAGSPVFYDRYRQRYLAFLYCNSISFAASVFIVALQLNQIMQKDQTKATKQSKLLMRATKMMLILDLVGLIAAYVAGTARGWEDAVAFLLLVLFSVATHAASWIQGSTHEK